MNCNICNSSTNEFVDSKTDIKYYHCELCQSIFKDPSNYVNFKLQKERYNLHENSEEDDGYKAYFQRFIDFLLEDLPKKQKALDFGCGASSLLAKMLAHKNIDCDYYDPIYHRNNLNKNLKYDLIVSTEVFEHLHEPRLVFKELIDMLEEGGHLAIQTQFHPNDVEKFKSWYYKNDSTHIVFFRSKTFEVLAEMYACKVIKSNEKNMVIIEKL